VDGHAASVLQATTISRRGGVPAVCRPSGRLSSSHPRSGREFLVKALVTGGAGFIGSTIASACLDEGIVPVIVDDFSTGRREFVEDRTFYAGDVADPGLMARIFAEHPDIFAVVHCAAKIVVPESVEQPLEYYRNNLLGLMNVLRCMADHGCHRFLFSSSAAIYAPGADLSVDEGSPLAPTSPYGRTKYMSELILADVAAAGSLRSLSLRYFNPIGADPSLRTGLQGATPSHALGKMIEAYEHGRTFQVTGVDWPTRDGSGIRDYIHVWDLARAHVAALQRFDSLFASGATSRAINIGTGEGTTVRELVAAFDSAVGTTLDVVEAPPRPGDVAGCYTRSDIALNDLGWRPEHSIEDGIRDSMAWAKRRPKVLADVL
jgi:UDP-glucose 4-epimerase